MLDWKSGVLMCIASAGLLASGMAALRSFETRANLVLFGLVLAWALLATPLILGFSGAYDAAPWLTFAPFNTELWIGPLWLLYIKRLTQERFRQRDWLWLAPGGGQTLYYMACFTLMTSAEAKFAYSQAVHNSYIVPVETALGLVMGGTAMVLSWRLLRRYKAWLPTRHGNSELYDLVWLERSLYAIAMPFILWLITDIWQAIFGGIGYYETFWLIAFAGIVLAYLAGDGLSRAHLRFPKMDAERDEAKPIAAVAVDRLDGVIALIREERLYEDATLNLSKLARAVGMSESGLSRLINSVEGRNFNTLINRLRVEAVCERLREYDGAIGNLLHVALQAGFGSKATFNRAFKAETGMSPRDWLKQEGYPVLQKAAAEATLV